MPENLPNNAAAPYTLGIDCGQTALKICVFDARGNELFSLSSPTEARYSGDGRTAELDMDLLWKKVCALLREITNRVPAGKIAAVGVSGHGNGVYPVDRDRKAFMPAILSTDMRALDVVSRWDTDGTSERIRKKILCSPWAGQPAPIIRSVKENEPRLFEKIHTVLSCADWINLCLTGEVSSDYGNLGTAGLIDQREKRTDSELAELYGLPELTALVPPAFSAGDRIGTVSKAAEAETGLTRGTSVTVGGFDVNCCCIGGGATDETRYSVIAGTWSINAAFTDEPVISDDLFSCNLYCDGKRYISIESSPTSAINLETFLTGHPDLTPRDCDILAESVDRHNDGKVIYLPYVKPLPTMPWLKGGYFGDADSLRLPEKIRVLYEGVAMGHLLHLRNLKNSGIVRASVRMTGGATRSRIWTQIFADVLGLPIEVPNNRSAGALGAAICAGVSAGMYGSVDEACREMISVKQVFYPDGEYTGYYQQKFNEFLRLIEIQGRSR